MDSKRQGEIALKMVKYLMRQKGFTLSPSNMRDAGNVAKTLGISVEELVEFAKPLVQELLDECFATK